MATPEFQLPVACPDQPAKDTYEAICHALAQVQQTSDELTGRISARAAELEERLQALRTRANTVTEKIQSLQGASKAMRSEVKAQFPEQRGSDGTACLFPGASNSDTNLFANLGLPPYVDQPPETTGRDASELYHLFKQTGHEPPSTDKTVPEQSLSDTHSITSLFSFDALQRSARQTDNPMQERPIPARSHARQAALAPRLASQVQELRVLAEQASDISTRSAALSTELPLSFQSGPAAEAGTPVRSPFQTESTEAEEGTSGQRQASSLPTSSSTGQPAAQADQEPGPSRPSAQPPRRSSQDSMGGLPMLSQGYADLQQSLMHRQLSFTGRESQDLFSSPPALR